MPGERRSCGAIKDGGTPCGAWAMREDDFCFRHSPATADAAREASRLGGMRRRKEGTIALAYDLDSVATFEDLQRVLFIAVSDALALDNTVHRTNALVYAVSVAQRVIHGIEFDRRLTAIEAAYIRRRPQRLV